MIRTSLNERKARGRAAETAASPPTRTKSSISVVTKRTFTAPSHQPSGNDYAKSGPVLAHAPMRSGAEWFLFEAFPGPARPFRFAPDKKRRCDREQEMT